MSEWIAVGAARVGRVALIVSDASGPVFQWSPAYFAAMLGKRYAKHWQFTDPIDLRACKARWVGEQGEPVDDAALDGAFVVSASGARVPLARTTILLGLESPEAFITTEIDSPSQRAGMDGARADTSPRAKRAATVAMALDAGADWIDQTHSPLGKRKHLRLCREGVFTSARKQGKQWLVRRAEIDTYITSGSKPPKTTDVGDIDRELAALGMGEP